MRFFGSTSFPVLNMTTIAIMVFVSILILAAGDGSFVQEGTPWAAKVAREPPVSHRIPVRSLQKVRVIKGY